MLGGSIMEDDNGVQQSTLTEKIFGNFWNNASQMQMDNNIKEQREQQQKVDLGQQVQQQLEQ